MRERLGQSCVGYIAAGSIDYCTWEIQYYNREYLNHVNSVLVFLCYIQAQSVKFELN